MLKKSLSALVMAALVCAQVAEASAPKSCHVHRFLDSKHTNRAVNGAVVVGGAVAVGAGVVWLVQHRHELKKGKKLATLSRRVEALEKNGVSSRAATDLAALTSRVEAVEKKAECKCPPKPV